MLDRLEFPQSPDEKTNFVEIGRIITLSDGPEFFLFDQVRLRARVFDCDLRDIIKGKRDHLRVGARGGATPARLVPLAQPKRRTAEHGEQDENNDELLRLHTAA